MGVRPRKSGWIITAAITCALLGTAQAQATRTVTIVTEPDASVWINGVLYGKTGADGKLVIRTVLPGRRSVRVRADGFSEVNRVLAPAEKGEIAVSLKETRDEAELAFQEAERQSQLDRTKAEAEYRKAIKLAPKMVAAHLGLVRLLADGRSYDKALAALRDLRKVSPRNAEATAIEGRIYKDLDEEPRAIAAFKRAIAEGQGFQPEAYAGLGLLYKEKAESMGDEGEAAQTAAYDLATKHLMTAVKQLSGAPDAAVLYQLVGLIYEEQKRYKEAIALYEDFLRIFPDSTEAEAVRSFIVQIRKEMEPQ